MHSSNSRMLRCFAAALFDFREFSSIVQNGGPGKNRSWRTVG
jgi:hypothetical protein